MYLYGGSPTSVPDDLDMLDAAATVTFGDTPAVDAAEVWDATGIAVVKQIGQAGAFATEDLTGQKSWQVIFLADEDTRALTAASPAQPSHPSAAVGRFDVGIDRVIHFTGAFGVANNAN